MPSLSCITQQFETGNFGSDTGTITIPTGDNQFPISVLQAGYSRGASWATAEGAGLVGVGGRSAGSSWAYADGSSGLSRAGRAAGSSWATAATGETDPEFSNVVFLAGWEGADGATTYSEEKNARAGTFSGNAEIDTAQFKFGTSSLHLDGSADNVSFDDHADWTLAAANSDPYCIETWIRFNSTGAIKQGIIGHLTTLAWAFDTKLSDPDNLQFRWYDGATTQTLLTTGGDLTTLNTWRHIAVDHDATGKIRIFIDGVMKGSTTPASSVIANTTALLRVGYSADGFTPIDGWLDDTRVTKASRYGSDSSFTPPTAEFPRS